MIYFSNLFVSICAVFFCLVTSVHAIVAWVAASVVVHLAAFGLYVIIKQPQDIKKFISVNPESQTSVVEIDLATIPVNQFNSDGPNGVDRKDYQGTATITAQQVAQYAGKNNPLYESLNPSDLWWFDPNAPEYQPVYSDPVPAVLYCEVNTQPSPFWKPGYTVSSYTINQCSEYYCDPTVTIYGVKEDGSTSTITWHYPYSLSSNIPILADALVSNGGYYPGQYYKTESSNIIYVEVLPYPDYKNYLYCGMRQRIPGDLISPGGPSTYPSRPGYGMGAGQAASMTVNGVISSGAISDLNIVWQDNIPSDSFSFDSPVWSSIPYVPDNQLLLFVRSLFSSRMNDFFQKFKNLGNVFDHVTTYYGDTVIVINFYGRIVSIDLADWRSFLSPVGVVMQLVVGALSVRIITRVGN